MNQKHLTSLLFALLSFIALLASSPAEDSEEARATLFPGETVSVLGAKITWNFQKDWETSGTLDVVCPTKSYVLPPKDTTIYIEEIALDIYKSDKSQPNYNVKARRFPSKYDFGGKPYEMECYVSNVCPITINNMKFRVTDEKKVFPNGVSFYMIEIEDAKNGETLSIPMNYGAQGKVSLMNVNIPRIYEDSKTALLRVRADADYSVRGKDAWVASYREADRSSLTLKEFLDSFGEKYGFTVKWIPVPNYPESIAKAQETNIPLYSVQNYTVADIIIGKTSHLTNLSLNWESPAILTVSYKDYEKELKEFQEQKERAEKDQKVREEFKNDYALETKVYPIKLVSVQMAKSLIEPELDTYYLASVDRKSPLEIMPGKPGIDVKIRPIIKHEQVTETVAADEKSQMLFLTATKKTHEKFQSLMKSVETMVSNAAQPADIQPLKLVVTLLEGGDSSAKNFEQQQAARFEGAGNAAGASWIEAEKAAEQYGISKDDLKVAGIQWLRLISTGMINLVPEKGEAGKSSISLTTDFSCKLEFLDQREPYLIVRASLQGTIKDKDAIKDLKYLENTIYLVPGKPTLMGITNLNGARIVILKLEPASPIQYLK